MMLFYVYHHILFWIFLFLLFLSMLLIFQLVSEKIFTKLLLFLLLCVELVTSCTTNAPLSFCRPRLWLFSALQIYICFRARPVAK